ncbi:ATP synthase subunit b [Aureimonas sp. SA4125]|uniref:F0F1 ATP synthase subunit B n=1 Tax=Aureimonas sp. SA4125 TaxID=2826993 RepID=UPI001CC7D1A8|nr:F0F1 ATP synthase subunit B [Aureimonas sp. SA4125]BDA83048.1 ATP synthase subunit b [Aureimonas sp. SA4125]
MFVTEAHAQTETPATDVAPVAGEHAPVNGEAAHGTAVGAPGESHSGVFPPMDTQFFPSQLLWLAISFGVFYLVLQKVILPRIGGILENRRDRVALDLDAAERMKSDADEALAAYEQDLAAARARSHQIAADARDAAKADADAERAEVEAELDRNLEAAQARIATIKQAALADVGQIAEAATAEMLSAVAGLDLPGEKIAGAVRAVRS